MEMTPVLRSRPRNRTGPHSQNTQSFNTRQNYLRARVYAPVSVRRSLSAGQDDGVRDPVQRRRDLSSGLVRYTVRFVGAQLLDNLPPHVAAPTPAR